MLLFHRPRKTVMKTRIWTVCLILLILTGYGCAARQTGSPGTGKAVLLRAQGGEICQETRSARMWQAGRGGIFSTMEAARDYAANLQLGGYDDWRLPTREESLNLVQIFFWKQNGDCAMNSQGDFWTVFSDRQASLGHWEDYLLCGPEFKYVKSVKTGGYVRAIRP